MINQEGDGSPSIVLGGYNDISSKLQWWGYRHINNSVQAKRFFTSVDISEAMESDMVYDVVGPFLAKDREEALSIIAQATKIVPKPKHESLTEQRDWTV